MNNPHHAEQQFTRWFDDWVKLNRKSNIRKKKRPIEYLEKIEIINHDFSPCKDCCIDLGHFLDKTKRESRNHGLKATIEWTKDYKDRILETTQESLKELNKKGWEFDKTLIKNFN